MKKEKKEKKGFRVSTWQKFSPAAQVNNAPMKGPLL